MEQHVEPVLYGTSAAARAVGCTEAWLRTLHSRGVISPRRDTSGRRVFSEADIEAARTHMARERRRGA